MSENMYINTKMDGFTIIELMITLVVAAILLSIAAPSFRDIIQDNRLTTEINSLSASLNLTRSEAIKRGTPATLCKSNDSVNCVATANWHDGWLVFDDIDGDGSLDSGETILRVVNGLTPGTTLIFVSGSNSVTYDPTGFYTGGNDTFRLCDSRGLASAKGLVISNSGRVRTANAGDLASCP